jgi:hypothetical protein
MTRAYRPGSGTCAAQPRIAADDHLGLFALSVFAAEFQVVGQTEPDLRGLRSRCRARRPRGTRAFLRPAKAHVLDELAIPGPEPAGLDRRRWVREVHRSQAIERRQDVADLAAIPHESALGQ